MKFACEILNVKSFPVKPNQQPEASLASVEKTKLDNIDSESESCAGDKAAIAMHSIISKIFLHFCTI